MGARDWTLIVVLALLFGSSFFFTEIAAADAGPLTIAAARLAVASLVLLALVRGLGNAGSARPPLWPLIVLGLFNSFVPITLIAWAQQSLASGVTAILAATSPVFGALLSHLVVPGEQLSWSRFAGTVLAFVGVALVLGPGAGFGFGGGLAPLAVLLAAAFSAGAGVFGRRVILGGVAPLHLATGQVVVAAVFATALSLGVEQPWARPVPAPSSIAALLVMGVVSTAGAYFLFFRLLARVGAANTLLVGFLVPISAVGLGIAFLGERLGLPQVAGLVLVLLALFIINRAALAKRRKPAER